MKTIQRTSLNFRKKYISSCFFFLFFFLFSFRSATLAALENNAERQSVEKEGRKHLLGERVHNFINVIYCNYVGRRVAWCRFPGVWLFFFFAFSPIASLLFFFVVSVLNGISRHQRQRTKKPNNSYFHIWYQMKIENANETEVERYDEQIDINRY